MPEAGQTLAHSASQRGVKSKQREEVLQLLRASLELPGWSPLSPRTTIAPGAATDSITQKLRDVGHTAQWSSTGLQVSPVLSTLQRQLVEQRLTQRPSISEAAQQELSLTSGVLSSLVQEGRLSSSGGGAAGLRPKTASSLSWAAKPSQRPGSSSGGVRAPGDLVAATTATSKPSGATATAAAAAANKRPKSGPAAVTAAVPTAAQVSPAAAMSQKVALRQVQKAAAAGTLADAAVTGGSTAGAQGDVDGQTAAQPDAAAVTAAAAAASSPAAEQEAAAAAAAAAAGDQQPGLTSHGSATVASPPRYMHATECSAIAAAQTAAIHGWTHSASPPRPKAAVSAAECPAVAKLAAAAVEGMVAAKQAAAAGEGGADYCPGTSCSGVQPHPAPRPGTSSSQRLMLDALPSRPATAMSLLGANTGADGAGRSWESTLRQQERPGSSSGAQQAPARPATAARGMTPQTALQALGSGDLNRTAVQRIVQQLRPGRGEALLVFEAMDRDKNGKITLAEFEEAAVSIGFNDEQAQRMFAKLDTLGRTYLEPRDWGSPGALHLVEQFSLMYLRRHMGFPNLISSAEQVRQYLANQNSHTVNSMPAAISAIRANAVRCGARAVTQGNPVWEAFRYMDMDGSGDLHREELKDAFSALGVQITEAVLDQIMSQFDLDDNGRIRYYEFLRTMFPSVGK